MMSSVLLPSLILRPRGPPICGIHWLRIVRVHVRVRVCVHIQEFPPSQGTYRSSQLQEMGSMLLETPQL